MANDVKQAVFDPTAMSGSVKRFAENQPGMIFRQEFEGGERRQPLGDAVSWDVVRMSRDLASVIPFGGASQSVKPIDGETRAEQLIDIGVYKDLDERKLFRDRHAGETVPNADAVLAEELEDLTKRVVMTQEFIAAKLLTTGALDLSTIPNSKATGTLTQNVTAVNQLADWNVAGTKIKSSEIPALKDTFHKQSGLMAMRMKCHKDFDQYIAQNDEITNFITEGSLAARMLQNTFLEGGSVLQLGGLSWEFSNLHYALDATPDTTVDVLSTDRAVILPSTDMRRTVFGVAEGLKRVPVGLYASAASANGLSRDVRGFWSYAKLMDLDGNLVIRIFAGWRGLYFTKLENGYAPFDAVA